MSLVQNIRLEDAEALEMLRSMPTAELMARADKVRRELHGNRTHYVHSHNLNPTNRCVIKCRLCSFWRDEADEDAYVTSMEDARQNLARAQDWDLTDLHIVGGMIPELDLKYYEELFSMAREMLPGVLLQGMTAVEIHWIAEHSGVSVRETLERLQAAGLGSLSGGGAEIFHPDIRKIIASIKIPADEWIDVHRTAHQMGIPTNATMLFGHIEKDEHIIDHLSRLRALQDETGGFLAAIPLPFQANGKALKIKYNPSGDRQVRIAALTRLYLDNFKHVRMLVNYTDRRLLGVLTHSGVDDIGGTSLDERIAKAAGAPQSQKFFSADEMEGFLRNLGHEPVLTNSIYENVKEDAEQKVSGTSDRWKPILDRAANGERLSAEEAVILHDEAPFQELGRAASIRRQQMVPSERATYVFDKNLNVTNYCVTECKFCAFHAKLGEKRGYTLTVDQAVNKVKLAAEKGATQILIQGGLNPELKLEYYEQCFAAIREQIPDIWVHSSSPTEIEFLAKEAGISIKECLQRLIAAGLQSLPGGGGEILVDEVRERVSPKKIRSQAWLDVLETANELGLRTTATMVYGLGETSAQRIEHLIKVRDVQDRTGGFTAFIPWSFSPDRTELQHLRRQNGIDYLRMIAIARLVLDNVLHLQAGWVTEGPNVAQLALQFGADDYGGVLMTEEVVSATGLNNCVNQALVENLIREAGWVPTQRTTQYQLLN